MLKSIINKKPPSLHERWLQHHHMCNMSTQNNQDFLFYTLTFICDIYVQQFQFLNLRTGNDMSDDSLLGSQVREISLPYFYYGI